MWVTFSIFQIGYEHIESTAKTWQQHIFLLSVTNIDVTKYFDLSFRIQILLKIT